MPSCWVCSCPLLSRSCRSRTPPKCRSCWVAWIVWVLAVITFLIGLQYLREALERQQLLGAMEESDVRSLLTRRVKVLARESRSVQPP